MLNLPTHPSCEYKTASFFGGNLNHEKIWSRKLLLEPIEVRNLTKYKSETRFKRVCTPNIYPKINGDLGVEGVFCSPWQLNLGIFMLHETFELFLLKVP